MTQVLTRYYLKVGQHIETGPDGKEWHYGGPTEFTSKTPDLARRWPEKFARVGDVAAPVAAPVKKPTGLSRDAEQKLDRMKVEELREFAAAEEIDLKGATSRDQALKIIKTTLGG